MALTEKHVYEELKKHGITSMDDLAKKIAEQSAAKAQFDKARGLTDKDNLEYIWSGKNYSIWHPEK
jgi:hypothetical protein